MPQATDLKTAMDAIGINNPDIPSDADLSDVVTTTAPAEKPIAKPTPAPDTSEKTEGVEADESTETEETEAGETETSKPEDEKQRRTWQSERDKALADAKKKAEEAEAKARELEIEKQKNQALMSMLAGVNSLRGNQPQPEAPPVKAKEDREPTLWDFIRKEDYDSTEKDDPDSVSGKAFLAWQDARTDYRTERKYHEQRAKEASEQARQMTLKQANDFVQAFPEYKNPFTGEPDLARINGWLETLSKTDWVTLKKAIDGMNRPTNGHAGVAPPQPKENAEAAIGKRANKPDSVASRGSAPPAPKKVPKEVQDMVSLYGENIYLPPGIANE